MKKSAGLAITYRNFILLAHPTNTPWENTYSIPKGMIESGEKPIDAAIRETKEEVGIEIDKSMINETDVHIMNYRNKKNKVYKKVYWWHVKLDKSINIRQELLQLEEVDWAGFLTYKEATKKIFHRFKPILKETLNNS